MCGFLEKKWLAQSRGALNLNKVLKVEVFCNYIYMCLTISFFNDHFLASVTTNHKIATKSDVLNKTTGVLKYATDKIGAGVVE